MGSQQLLAGEDKLEKVDVEEKGSDEGQKCRVVCLETG
jgi:hypothetical protein